VNAFDQASIVGDLAVEKALRLFRERAYHGQIVTTFKGRLSEELQRSAGDLLFNTAKDPDRIVTVEIKGEDKFTGNFFLEYWSNRSRLTPGWMLTLRADLLCYVFNDAERAFIIGLPKLQQWAFIRMTERRRFDGHIYRFPLAAQGKYEQPNDTWGRLVPIGVVRREVGLIEWDLKTWAPVPDAPSLGPLFAQGATP
jgi:hypothetical protein